MNISVILSLTILGVKTSAPSPSQVDQPIHEGKSPSPSLSVGLPRSAVSSLLCAGDVAGLAILTVKACQSCKSASDGEWYLSILRVYTLVYTRVMLSLQISFTGGFPYFCEWKLDSCRWRFSKNLGLSSAVFSPSPTPKNETSIAQPIRLSRQERFNLTRRLRRLRRLRGLRGLRGLWRPGSWNGPFWGHRKKETWKSQSIVFSPGAWLRTTSPQRLWWFWYMISHSTPADHWAENRTSAREAPPTLEIASPCPSCTLEKISNFASQFVRTPKMVFGGVHLTKIDPKTNCWGFKLNCGPVVANIWVPQMRSQGAAKNHRLGVEVTPVQPRIAPVECHSTNTFDSNLQSTRGKQVGWRLKVGWHWRQCKQMCFTCSIDTLLVHLGSCSETPVGCCALKKHMIKKKKTGSKDGTPTNQTFESNLQMIFCWLCLDILCFLQHFWVDHIQLFKLQQGSWLHRHLKPGKQTQEETMGATRDGVMFYDW